MAKTRSKEREEQISVHSIQITGVSLPDKKLADLGDELLRGGVIIKTNKGRISAKVDVIGSGQGVLDIQLRKQRLQNSK